MDSCNEALMAQEVSQNIRPSIFGCTCDYMEVFVVLCTCFTDLQAGDADQVRDFVLLQKKSYLHYTRVITPNRVTRG